MKKENLEQSLTRSLKTDLTNVSSGLAEAGIDSALESGLLKDIPVVNTLIGLYKSGVSLRERRYIQNLIAFLSEFNEISADKKDNFIEKNIKNEKDKLKC